MNSAKEFFHDDALLNFTISGTRSRQSTVIESVIKQILNESVPMNDLLFNINDDTEDSLTTVVLKDLQEEVLEKDEDVEDDTIVIENTRDNNQSIIKDDDLDLLESSINQSSINQSSTNFLDKKIHEEETESAVNEHGFSELMEKTGMNLLDTSSKMEPSNNINVAASIVSPTMNSSSGKSQTVLLQPSFVNNGKDESSSKVSKSEKKMVSLRKKKSTK